MIDGLGAFIAQRRKQLHLTQIAARLPETLPALADHPDTMRAERVTRLTEIQTRRRRLAVAIASVDDPSNMIAEDNRLAAEERALTEQIATAPPLITIARLRAGTVAAREIVPLVATAYRLHDQSGLVGVANRIGLRVIVDGDRYAVSLRYDEVFERLVTRPCSA